ncbi:hypothetical protein L208DRAFT_477656 [Tricholoma matsutake]|nr:hypothetical protein L208DRAFT_477656 [Tricholoma matsutake 945]
MTSQYIHSTAGCIGRPGLKQKQVDAGRPCHPRSAVAPHSRPSPLLTSFHLATLVLPLPACSPPSAGLASPPSCASIPHCPVSSTISPLSLPARCGSLPSSLPGCCCCCVVASPTVSGSFSSPFCLHVEYVLVEKKDTEMKIFRGRNPAAIPSRCFLLAPYFSLLFGAHRSSPAIGSFAPELSSLCASWFLACRGYPGPTAIAPGLSLGMPCVRLAVFWVPGRRCWHQ